MRILIVPALTAAAALAAALADGLEAQTAPKADITWVNATTNTNGTAIPATGPGSLARTTVEYGTCGAGGVFGVKQGEITVVPPATAAQVSMVVVQQYCFAAFHSNTYATTFAPCLDPAVPASCPLGNSGRSNVAAKNNPAPRPTPPAGLTVGADNVAWQIVQSLDMVAWNAVGVVAPGTSCDGAQQVLDKFLVPRASVTWYGNARPQAVFASCG